MNKRIFGSFPILISVLDLLSVTVAFIAGTYLQRGINHPGQDYLPFILAGNLAWVGGALVSCLYRETSFLKGQTFIRNSVKAFFIFLAGIFLAAFFYNFSAFRSYLFISTLFFGGVLVLTRALYALSVRPHHSLGGRNKKVVFIGYNPATKRIAALLTEKEEGTTVMGYFEDPEHIEELSRYPILGKGENWLEYAIKNGVTHVYVTLPSSMEEEPLALAQKAAAAGITLQFVVDFNSLTHHSMQAGFIENIPVLSFKTDAQTEEEKRIRELYTGIGERKEKTV